MKQLNRLKAMKHKPSDQCLLFHDGLMIGDQIVAKWNARFKGEVIDLTKKYSLIATIKWDFGATSRLLAEQIRKL